MLTSLARIAKQPFRHVADGTRRWTAATAGVAAVEFSIVLPVMIAIYLGMTEVTPAINIKRKLTLTARGVADLSARSKDLSSDELKIIFGASNAIMRPYDSIATQMVVTSVNVTKVGALFVGTVDWSCGWNLPTVPGTEDLKVRLGTYPVPPQFQEDGVSFMLAETQYPYTPVIGRAITGTMRLSDTTPWPVRGTSVTLPSKICPIKT